MSIYDDLIMTSDLDTYKNSGQILTDSLTFSGVLAGAGSQTQSTSPITVSNLDYLQILFDNSIQHSGKFKSLSLENGLTMIHETTTPSDIVIKMSVIVSGSTIQVTGIIINPYAGAVNLQSTTINLRYIPYEATI